MTKYFLAALNSFKDCCRTLLHIDSRTLFTLCVNPSLYQMMIQLLHTRFCSVLPV